MSSPKKRKRKERERERKTYKLILVDIGQGNGQFWQQFGTQCLLQRMYSCLCNNDPFLDQFIQKSFLSSERRQAGQQTNIYQKE